jgi:hypothetical protein
MVLRDSWRALAESPLFEADFAAYR